MRSLTAVQRPGMRLAGASGLMLFIELALIRWLGSEIPYLSYFSNFVLLGSFLGIGLAFIRRTAFDAFRLVPAALALLVAAVLIAPISVSHSNGDFILVGAILVGLPPWVVLPLTFLAVAGTMYLAASEVARLFVTFPPLDAYRLDIIGSIAGILVFAGLSFGGTPPLAWGIVIAVVYILLRGRRLQRLDAVFLVAILVLLGRGSFEPNTGWSPYYKVSTIASAGPPAETTFYVNRIPHQGMVAVRDIPRASGASPLAPFTQATHPLRDVLVIGAGNGRDVALALSRGATHVDAVEIDPYIASLGQRLNPDRAYQDPRVSLYIDDGRAFLERTTSRYDLIILAQTDSLTIVSGQSSLRLESFLFTSDSVASIRRHLTTHGVFSAFNLYWQQWYVDRLAGTMNDVFGHPPCISVARIVGAPASMTVGLAASDLACPTTWETPPDLTRPATDDYPFAYLRTASIPGLYLVALGLILAASLVATRVVGGPFGRMRPFLDMFFMGAAFLLLETKSVVQFALLFGTTWVVNALVFIGILVAVLAAVEISRVRRIARFQWLYPLLLGSLGIAWLVPAESLLTLTFWPRLAAAVGLTFMPVMLANLVFAERLRAADRPEAFGANLLGAMVGGVLEYASLVVGYRALLLVVAALYGLAFLAGRGFRAPAALGSRTSATRES